MILDDVKDEIKTSEETEKAAVEAFEKLMSDINTSIEDANKVISDLKGDIATSEEEITLQMEAKTDSKKELDTALEAITSAEPGCNFIGLNFEVRTKNRQLEIDGLLKAKTILQGGSFATPE